MRYLDSAVGLVAAVASILFYVSVRPPAPPPAGSVSLDRSPRAYIRSLEADLAKAVEREGGVTDEILLKGPDAGIVIPTYIDEATAAWRRKRDRPTTGPTSIVPVAVPVGTE